MRGLLIAVPFTPAMMRKYPKRFLSFVKKALKLAQDRDVRVVGLGGWLPSQTGYGLNIKKATAGIGLTTGHSLAALTTAQ